MFGWSKYKDAVVNMDTAYWGRGFGLMVIKDAFRNKILWYKFVRNETIADYMEGIAWLRGHSFRTYGIVCDGIRGLFPALYLTLCRCVSFIKWWSYADIWLIDPKCRQHKSCSIWPRGLHIWIRPLLSQNLTYGRSAGASFSKSVHVMEMGATHIHTRG